MIKVIRDNTKQELYTICTSCGSELSYFFEDVRLEEAPYNYMPNRYIKCPICGKDTFAELKPKETFTYNPFGQFRFPFLTSDACCTSDAVK